MSVKGFVGALTTLTALSAAATPVAAQDVAAQLEQMRKMCRQTEQTSMAACNRSSSNGAASRGNSSSSGRYESEQRGRGAVVDRGSGNSGQQCLAKVKQETASCLARVDAVAKELQSTRARR